MSILTDFYHLKLTTHFNNINIDRDGTPDKDIIIKFFEKHAPNVLEFYEYTTAEGEHRTRADTKPNTDPEGTLWMFEMNSGRSWFNGECFIEFYEWHIRLHQMIHSYLNTGIVKRGMLDWIASLIADLRPELVFRDKDDNLYTTSRDGPGRGGPRDIEIGKYSFYEALTTSSRDRNKLNLDAFRQGLFVEIRDWLNGKVKIGRCEYEGCEKIFVVSPSGKPGQYCTNSHRVMAHRKRKALAATP